MPRKAIDYSKIVIYKIVCNDLTIKDTYVGSTTDFRKRKWNHKATYNAEKSFKIYKTIRENGGWENWSMIEIEKFPCKDGNEAHTRERYWFEQLQATLNTNFPKRTNAEYRETHVEQVKEYQATYNKENAEIKRQKSNQYYASHIEQIKQKNKRNYEKRKNLKMNENNVED